MFRVGIRSVCVMGFLGVEVSAGDRPAVFRILRGELGLAVAAWQVLTWAQRRSSRMPEFQGSGDGEPRTGSAGRCDDFGAVIGGVHQHDDRTGAPAVPRGTDGLSDPHGLATP